MGKRILFEVDIIGAFGHTLDDDENPMDWLCNLGDGDILDFVGNNLKVTSVRVTMED